MFKKIVLALFILAVVFNLIGCSKEKIQMNEQNKKKEKWEISPVFKQDGFIFQGEEGRIGVNNINNENPTVFYINKREIYFWRFFGQKEFFGDEIKIIAHSKDKNEEIVILTTTRESKETPLINFSIPVEERNSETGVQIQENITSRSIPSEGVWRLDVYFDDKYFASVVIEFINGEEENI